MQWETIDLRLKKKIEIELNYLKLMNNIDIY